MSIFSKPTKMKYQFTPFLLAIFILFSCKSAKDFYQEGRFDKALESLDKKAAKGELSRDERNLYVDAFNDWTEAENKKLDTYYASHEYKDWKKGLKSLDGLEDKQNKIKRYKQLKNQELIFIGIDQWRTDFNQVLLTYHQTNIDNYFGLFEQKGDKSNMINAYNQVQDLKKYSKDKLHIDSLQEICLNLGHRYFSVQIKNNTFGNFFEFNNQFENNINLYNDKWSTFSNTGNADTDYEIIISLEDIDQREDASENRQTYSRQVIDRYETQTDTAGNSTEIPIYENISAEVNEVRREYIAQGRAVAVIIWRNDNRRVFSEDYRLDERDGDTKYYLVSGNQDAVPDNINLETFSINNYDYDDLVEEVLERLARAISDDLNNF